MFINENILEFKNLHTANEGNISEINSMQALNRKLPEVYKIYGIIYKIEDF